MSAFMYGLTNAMDIMSKTLFVQLKKEKYKNDKKIVENIMLS